MTGIWKPISDQVDVLVVRCSSSDAAWVLLREGFPASRCARLNRRIRIKRLLGSVEIFKSILMSDKITTSETVSLNQEEFMTRSGHGDQNILQVLPFPLRWKIT